MLTEKSASLENFEKEFAQEIVIVGPGPKARSVARGRKVGVYVDGLFTTMSEDTLNFLIEIGFYEVEKRKPIS